MTQASDIIIFDRHCIQKNRERSLKKYHDHDFLFRWTETEISSRILDINRHFDVALNIGSRSDYKNHPKIGTLHTCDLTYKPYLNQTNYFQASEEFLPAGNSSLNLILSTLNLHTVNDLPGTLVQIRRALKPDGLFLGALLGGETLHELRTVLTETELQFSGGISPRVFPFADKPQMGDLLQRAGFALPVVDSEIITVTYPSLFKLMADIRGMGEGNAIHARFKKPLPKTFFLDAAKRYNDHFSEQDGKITATFEIIFLLGWAPHDSQQKPMRPGSAKQNLAQILGTQEISLEDETKP